MDQETPNTAPPSALPPVLPPSGRFIAQLFLVPGSIVLVAVLIMILINYTLTSGYNPEHFLKRLDSPNADIRWRGASDLAQVLEKKESVNLRTDVDFALDLTERLERGIADLDLEEKVITERLEKAKPDERERAWKKLAPQRHYVSFLSSTLARLHAPVGLKVLGDLAQRQSPDLQGNTLLRRQALLALAVLGDGVQNFSKLPAEHQTVVLDRLRAVAEQSGARASWARAALMQIDTTSKTAWPGDFVAMDQVLARCALADDPYQRELAAMALLFWDGPLAEPTLLKLARDQGQGTLVRIKGDD